MVIITNGGDKIYNSKMYISYTSIVMFKTCKRKFKYRYIDRISKNPVNSPSLSLGLSIHNVLSKFNNLSPEQQTKNSLFELLNNEWISDGFSSAKTEERFLKSAKAILSNYFSERRDEGKVILSEGLLSHQINNKIILVGKIDKLFLNSNNAIEILDYKTGNIVLSKEQMLNDFQLPLYFLLTKYKLNILPKVISYYYLIPNYKVSIEVTKEIFERGVLNLKKEITEILKEEKFPCNPSNYCKKSCEYYSLCEAYNPKIKSYQSIGSSSL